jgi:hypothetical protein
MEMYQMRGLPCHDGLKEMPWSVCGRMSITLDDGTVATGGGVLEWCWDKEDALERMEMMQQDPRFSNLSVRPS